MIAFNCPNCGKSFSVNDELAGRSGKCSVCKSPMIVPIPGAARGERITISFDDPPPVAIAKLPLRTRRLIQEAEEIRRAFRNFPLIRIRKTEGDPPERYEIEYLVGGLMRGSDGTPVHRGNHLAEIQLTREYPVQQPKCKMLTPIFHPNIEPSMICANDNYTSAERLVDLIVRIGEFITFQQYNNKSPLDGAAAMWADQNSQHLPVDRSDLYPPEAD